MTRTKGPARRLIVWRHTLFGGNVQAGLTGVKALAVVNSGRRQRDYDDWPLLPNGLRQAGALAELLRPYLIDVCLASPTQRTGQTAATVLRGRGVTLIEHEALRERDRGRFAYVPDWWADGQPDYGLGKENPFTWRPTGGETLLEVVERIKAAVAYADQLAPGGTVGICTHGETMTALRVLVGGRDTVARLREPLPPYGRASYTGQVQADIYERRGRAKKMTHFMTLGLHNGHSFRTDWMAI
jgi:broad specificity phosphatase PhoE